MAVSENKKIIQRIYTEIWSQWSETKVSELKEIFTSEILLHLPGGQEFKGFEFYCGMMNWYAKHFINQEYILEDLIQEDNKVVARHTTNIDYVGGWHDLPPVDKRLKETGMNIFRFNEEGKVEEMWCEMSDLDVMNQIRPLNNG